MPGEYTFYAGSKLLEPLGAALGISVDKVNLVASQLISLPLAIWFYKRLAAGQTSRLVRLSYPPLIGLALMFFCYGPAMKHLLANAGICYILLRFSPTQHVHKLVFVAAMGYLSFIHMYRWLILSSYSIDITGPMMILVQKATTIAFSLHDGKMKKTEELNDIQKKEAIPEVPSFLEYVSFMFHFQTVLTGPLCFFADYIDFIDGRHVRPKSTAARPKNSNNNENDVPTPWAAVTEKLMWCLVFLCITVVVSPQFQPEIMLEAEMLRRNFFSWYLTLFLVMMLQRVQYYFVWMFADAICNASGLGFAGYDEHGKAKWDLVSNVNPYQCEMATNFKDTLDAWNCTTMYWLRRVAYDRAPAKFRTVATYLLSAWWHGFFPGYYLTFLTGALFTVAGRTTRRCLRHRFLDDSTKKLLYDIATFIATKVALSYCTYAFVTMKFAPGWNLFKEIYFFMHIFALIAIFVLPKVLPPPKRQQVDHQTPSSKPVKVD